MSHATQLHHRRDLHDSLESIHRRGLPGNGKGEVCQELHQAVTTTVKGGVAHSLEEE